MTIIIIKLFSNFDNLMTKKTITGSAISLSTDYNDRSQPFNTFK